jgi:metal-dependent amidase/aminoacylase/carboxypeptidase family protein
LLVGSANADQGLDFGHHHPRFDFDEGALPLSVGLMAALAAEFLMIDGE